MKTTILILMLLFTFGCKKETKQEYQLNFYANCASNFTYQYQVGPIKESGSGKGVIQFTKTAEAGDLVLLNGQADSSKYGIALEITCTPIISTSDMKVAGPGKQSIQHQF